MYDGGGCVDGAPWCVVVSLSIVVRLVMPTIMMLFLLIVIWWCTISRRIGMTRHLPFSECQYPAPGYIIMLDSCYTLASDALLHESRHKASIPPPASATT